MCTVYDHSIVDAVSNGKVTDTSDTLIQASGSGEVRKCSVFCGG